MENQAVSMWVGAGKRYVLAKGNLMVFFGKMVENSIPIKCMLDTIDLCSYTHLFCCQRRSCDIRPKG